MSHRGLLIPFVAFVSATLAFTRAGYAGHLNSTVTGQAYDNNCVNNGVPLPPPWGDTYPNANPWVFNGYLETDTSHGGSLSYDQAYLSPFDRGFVYYYVQTTAPQGVCMVVPRVTPGSSGFTNNFPVICQGINGKACFWDSPEGTGFWDICNGSTSGGCPNNLGGKRVYDTPLRDFASQNVNSHLPDYNAQIDDEWLDIVSMDNLQQGTEFHCSDCHAGENVFVNHPRTATDLYNYGSGPVSRSYWFPSAWPDPMVPFNLPISSGPDTSTSMGGCASCHTQQGFGGRLPLTDVNFTGFSGTVLQTTMQRALVSGAPFPNGCLPSDIHCPNGAMPDLQNGYAGMMEEWSDALYDTHWPTSSGADGVSSETNANEQHFSWTSDVLGRGQSTASPYTTTMWNYNAGYCFVTKLNPGHTANDVFMALDANDNFVLSGVHDTNTAHARARIDATCVPWATLNAASATPATPGQVWNPGAEPGFQGGFPTLPAPHTGSASVYSAHASGTHTRSFSQSPTTMPSGANFIANDKPYLWVYLTAGDAPTEIMLEITATDGSVGRGYWGSSNPIGLTAFKVGGVPGTGSWKNIALLASQFLPTAMTGKRVNGMKVYFYGGSGYVDDIGYLANGGGAEKIWVEDAVPSGAIVGAPGSGEAGDGWIWALKNGVGWSNSGGGTGTITTTLPVDGWSLCQIAGFNGAFPSSGTSQSIALKWPKAVSGIFSNSGNNWVLNQTASASSQRTATMCADFSLQNAWASILSTNYGYSVYSQGLDYSLTQVASNGTTDVGAPFSFSDPDFDFESICSIMGASGLLVSTAETDPTASVATIDDYLNGSWAAKTNSPGSWFTTCYETVGGAFNEGGWFFY